MRQITLAFGRPSRKSKFGPRSNGGAALPPALPIAPPLSPIPSVESPTNLSPPNAARIRVSSASPTEEQGPPQSDLTRIILTVPVRPLPAITAEVKRVDKGKGRALTPPMPLPVQKDVTSGKPRSRDALRPLPQFPRNSTGSLSSYEGTRHPDPDSLLSVTSFLSLSSPQPSLDSAYSSNPSLEGASEKALPILETQDNINEEADKTDSEHSSSLSIDTRRRDLQSRRTTRTSVWSQESAVTASRPLDMEAALIQLLDRARS